jgi:hypothetical protein
MTLPSAATTTSKGQPSQKIDAARNWTTLKAGNKVSGLTITLAEGAAWIRGQFENSEGAKLSADLHLYLVPAEKERAEDVLRYFISELTPEGTFSADNLPPGRYWLLAQRSSGSERLTTRKLQLPDAAESRVTIRRAAEAIHNEIELKPCQNIADYRLRFEP